MAQIEKFRLKSRRNPVRQWLGIEFSAYVLVCLVLVTTAWKNNFVSTAAILLTWVIAGGALTLAVRGIYRERHQRSLQNQSDRSG